MDNDFQTQPVIILAFKENLNKKITGYFTVPRVFSGKAMQIQARLALLPYLSTLPKGEPKYVFLYFKFYRSVLWIVHR